MRIGRLVMGLLYIGAGVAHFVITKTYVPIVPDYFPDHRGLVLLTGVAEIAGGVGVLLPARFLAIRRAAAWGIVAMLTGYFTVHIWMLQHAERYANVPLWALWGRIPLQFVLIWWAWLYTRDESR